MKHHENESGRDSQNMAEENGAQQPLIPSESLYDRLVKWAKNNVIFVVIGIAATIVALVAAFLDDIETLTKGHLAK